MNTSPIVPNREGTVPSRKERLESLHQKMRRIEVSRSHSLACLVLSGILVVVGLIFLYASFKYDSTRSREFRPQSIEFATCIAVSSIGLILGVYGGIRATIQSVAKRRVKREIDAL